jgi:hypothetical protein
MSAARGLAVRRRFRAAREQPAALEARRAVFESGPLPCYPPNRPEFLFRSETTCLRGRSSKPLHGV